MQHLLVRFCIIAVLQLPVCSNEEPEPGKMVGQLQAATKLRSQRSHASLVTQLHIGVPLSGRSRRDLTKTLTHKYQSECTDRPEQANVTVCLGLMSELIQLNGGRLPDRTRHFSPVYVCGRIQPLLYDPEVHICCSGVLHTVISGREQCCNDKLLDTADMFCCAGTLHQVADDGSLQCCGTFVYNNSREMCCHDKLHNRTTHTKCCYDSVYDSAHEVCCRNTVHYGRKKRCCDRKAYLKNVSACCTGVLHDVIGRRNRHGQCCGAENIDVRCYKCVNFTKNALYNRTMHICLHGTIRLRTTNSTVDLNGTFMLTTWKTHLADSHSDASSMPIKFIVIVCSGTLVLVMLSVPLLRKMSCKKKMYSSFGELLFALSHSSIDSRLTTYFQRNRRNNVPTGSITGYDFITDRQSVHSVSMISMRSVLPMNCEDVFSNDTYAISSIGTLGTASSSIDDYPVQPLEGTNETIQDLKDLDLETLMKTTQTPQINFFASHFVNAETQTMESKSCNKQTIFGKKFQYSCIVDDDNNMFQIPGSEVQVVFPKCLTKNHGVEVLGSTFSSISDVRKRFDMSPCEAIASPVTEYHVTGHSKFPEYACVKVPFIGVSSKLNVWKFLSEDGITQKTKRLQVPIKGQNNDELNDMFYEIEGSTCLIYTRSFSGFFCSTDQSQRELNLRTFLYASYKRFQPMSRHPRHEVRVRMYIADELMKFRDYKQRMNDNEKDRTQKEEKVLKLHEELCGEDFLVAFVAPADDNEDQWMHKRLPGSEDPIFAEKQTLQLKDVVQPCPNCSQCHVQPRELPICLEWYLTNRPRVSPPLSFQCLVQVDCVKETTDEKQSTTLIIDELPLRPEDRFQVQHQDTDISDRLCHIKNYVMNMDVGNRNKLLAWMGQGPFSVDKLFEELQLHFKPAGIFRQLIDALSSLHLYNDLDYLFTSGLIPSSYCSRPVQRVENPEGTNRSPYPFIHPSDSSAMASDPTGARHIMDIGVNQEPTVRGSRDPEVREFIRPMTESSLFFSNDSSSNCPHPVQAATSGPECLNVYTPVDLGKTSDAEFEPHPVQAAASGPECHNVYTFVDLGKTIDEELEPLPVQEQASMEETYPKFEDD